MYDQIVVQLDTEIYGSQKYKMLKSLTKSWRIDSLATFKLNGLDVVIVL